MARQLILDTNTLIAYERGAFDTTALDDDDLAIAAITVAEFRVGVELARTATQAAQRARVLAVILDVITVLDYRAHCHRTCPTPGPRTPNGHSPRRARPHHRRPRRRTHPYVGVPDARARFSDLPGVNALDPLAGHDGGV